MRIVIWLAAAAATAGLLVLASGFLLPATRSATVSTVLDAPPERVRAVILDLEAQPSWRPDVLGVERTADGWRETRHGGETIDFRLVADALPLIAMEFASTYGYRGGWEARLDPEGSSTRLTVTEHATVTSPLGRILARMFFDPAEFSRTYLGQLSSRLSSGNGT